MNKILRCFQDIIKEYNIEYIDIFQRIYKPSTNAIDPKTAKAVEVKRVKEFNDFLKKFRSSLGNSFKFFSVYVYFDVH